MKERPILFSGPMVRAILNGTKTQTRRVVKLKGGTAGLDTMCPRSENEFVDIVFRELEKKCPYGQPGDRLWVKEAHFESRKWRHAPLFAVAPDFMYRADYEYREEPRSVIGCHHWRPSIFCTRQASRITLEVVSVRVERLQDISEVDAVAEGIEPVQMPTGVVMFYDYLKKRASVARAVSSYATLWESINGAGSWAANPWVWVVEFNRR